jgi:hypothetical protein
MTAKTKLGVTFDPWAATWARGQPLAHRGEHAQKTTMNPASLPPSAQIPAQLSEPRERHRGAGLRDDDLFFER